MAKKEHKANMTLEEARAYRASLHVPKEKDLTDKEKRESFRMFWAQSRKKYGNKSKELEQILWLHLKATGNDVPEKFEDGISHFGLKKVS